MRREEINKGGSVSRGQNPRPSLGASWQEELWRRAGPSKRNEEATMRGRKEEQAKVESWNMNDPWCQMLLRQRGK